jgi:hypothetical protein
MTEGYIHNAVQTATPLPVVYRSLQRGHQTTEEIEDDTQLSTNQISDALNGLQLLRLVEKIEKYQPVDLPIDYDDWGLRFRLSVLHNVAQEAQPAASEWGKQSALLVNFEYLVEDNIQFFNRTDTAVADDMDAYQREVNYHPKDSKGDRNDMNQDKLTNWARMANLLGLVRQAQGTDFTTYPDPKLLYATMQLSTDELEDPAPQESKYPRIAISEYFEWIRHNFLRISLTDEGNIPEVLSRTFEYLSDQKRIRLVEAGDAGAVDLVNIPHPPTMDSDANSIEVR